MDVRRVLDDAEEKVNDPTTKTTPDNRTPPQRQTIIVMVWSWRGRQHSGRGCQICMSKCDQNSHQGSYNIVRITHFVKFWSQGDSAGKYGRTPKTINATGAGSADGRDTVPLTVRYCSYIKAQTITHQRKRNHNHSDDILHQNVVSALYSEMDR